jgi:hypothetical protein
MPKWSYCADNFTLNHHLISLLKGQDSKNIIPGTRQGRSTGWVLISKGNLIVLDQWKKIWNLSQKTKWVQVVGLFRRSFFRQWAFLKIIKNIKFNE